MREIAQQIYDALNAKGAGLGNVSITFIESTLKKANLEVVKSLDPKVDERQITSSGMTNFCSWERLKPYLAQASGADQRGEKVIGVVAFKDGVKIRLADDV